MELWKKMTVIFGIIGLVYSFVSVLYMGAQMSIEYPIGPRIIIWITISPFLTLVKLLDIIGPIGVIVNVILWTLLFSIIGALIGKYVERYRSQKQDRVQSK